MNPVFPFKFSKKIVVVVIYFVWLDKKFFEFIQVSF